jgi:hypothetical protein
MVSAGGVRDGAAAPTGSHEEEAPLADVPRGPYIHSQEGHWPSQAGRQRLRRPNRVKISVTLVDN